MWKKYIKVEKEEYQNFGMVSLSQLKDVLRPGIKFHTCYDNDPWYMVNHIKDGDNNLVVIKSWSKYKQRWTYKVEHLSMFMWMMGFMEELYKDSEGKFHIKDRKR